MSKHFTPPKNSKKVTIDIAALEQEKRKLSVSKENLDRLEEVKRILDYLYYGIKY